MNIKHLLSERTQTAFAALGLPADSAPAVAQSAKPQFGQYQINGVMGLAKKMGQNPRQLAEQVLAQLDLSDLAERVEIAGPGFINVHLKPQWLAAQLAAANNQRLGVAKVGHSRLVIDYSGPNLAKEMHVGHLRSTIIGDACARVAEFLGDEVIRQNHVGDWGTQFGMLIAHLEDQIQAGVDLDGVALSDLEDFYRQAKQRFDAESGFADKARSYVVRLQQGDAHCAKLWQLFIDTSIGHSNDVYARLNVGLRDEHIVAESSYNAALAQIVADLKAQGIATENDGATLVFINELADKEGNPSPFIVQKTDGGFLYATTDLAACQYRSQQLQADRIVIFTDDRQGLHFKQVEIVARKAGFLLPRTQFEHCPFGAMLGSDGKPFKTRTGGTVKLTELLDEAVQRAQAVVTEKNPELPAAEAAEVARKVGIGAVKFADLSKNRTSAYLFSWEAMLSFEGATAPYLQYAYSRIASVLRRAESDASSGQCLLQAPQEFDLALKLLRLEETLLLVHKDNAPNHLCQYLFELASLFMTFYEACPILKEGVAAELRASRLQLCRQVAQALHLGLDLLGIDTMERM